MPTHNASHQGTLRGSVMLPAEPVSDGDMAYKSALSELDSDNSSDTGDPPPRYSHPKHDTQHAGYPEGEEVPADSSDQQSTQGMGGTLRKKTPKDGLAYVAPIGKIPGIASIHPKQSNPQPTPPPEEDQAMPKKPPVHEIQKDHLVGKKIDEFGDIVDDDGSVLGRVEGDLPSMIGRRISNARGDVLGDDGELLGYVAELGAGESEQNSSKEQIPTWSLADAMKAMAAAGNGPGGLRVDLFGNILDPEGNIVGSFHDNISGFGKKIPAAAFGDDRSHGQSPKDAKETKESKPRPQEPQPKEAHSQDQKAEKSTKSPPKAEPRENAQSHRKEDPKESPSDIFLDVKSTTEGIQLTIRIPTVFNSGGQPAQPKIVFS